MKTAGICKLLLLLSFGACTASFAQQRPCSLSEAKQADREASRVRSWDAMYRSFRRFAPRCDDGSIGEGYSESVARILLDHWSTLPRLIELTKDDHAFKEFVLRHVDATMDYQDLEKIRGKAAHSCPSGQNSFCAQLKQAADRAISE